MASITQWTPYRVALDITATASTVTRTSATSYTVKINVSWKTHWSGAKTDFKMVASSGGASVTLNKLGTTSSSGSGTITGSYSISGAGGQTKSISVKFTNSGHESGQSSSKTITLSVTVPAIKFEITLHGNEGTLGSTKKTWLLYGVQWQNSSNNAISEIAEAPTRTGYVFAGFYTAKSGGTKIINANKTFVRNKLTFTTSDTTLYAHWTPSTNTPYQVKHWKQKIDGGSAQNSTNFDLAATENKTGTTATSVTPTVKSYTGFTSPSDSSLTIKADGTSVKNYYYTRNSYTLTLYKGTGISAVTGAGSYRYGKSVTINATVSTGYYWTGWTGTKASTTKNYTFTMPAQAVTNTANAVAKTLTVQYQKNDGSGDTAEQSFTYGANGGNDQQFGYELDGKTPHWGIVTNEYAKLYGFGHWYREGYKIIGWATSATGSATLTSPYYLVKDTWINAQVGSAASKTIKLYAVWDYNGLVRIYTSKGWQMAIPYVYSGGWKQALPYIYDNSERKWKQGV